MIEILALDVATTTGWARGPLCGQPAAGSVCFGAYDASDNAIFGNALRWLSELLAPEPRPDLVILEAMLPPEAMKGHTSRAVRDRLAGLHGVLRAAAYLRGIYRIEAASVAAVRHHFIGEPTLKRDAAKRATILKCRKLGWACANDNEGDAIALWSFACGQLDPETALRVSPLFNRKLRGSADDALDDPAGARRGPRNPLPRM